MHRPADPRPIAFVLSSLQCGGAERVAVLVAGGLARRGHPVVLITLVDPAAHDFYPVPPGVHRVALSIRPLYVADHKSEVFRFANPARRNSCDFCDRI